MEHKKYDFKELIERMHNGSIYFCDNTELAKWQLECQERLYDYNNTRPREQEKRQELLKEMFAEIGDNCYIEPPLRSNFGGHHVHFGKNIYANYNLTLVDDTHIYVDDNVMFGPNVVVCTATHPIDPNLRLEVAQYNKPIHIHKNAWIGGNVFIMPGVSIGENSVIGAGSVVTKDIPANVIALGNPARVYRKITEDDKRYYDKGKKIEL